MINSIKKKMNVIVIPMLQDNFCYYVYKRNDIQKGFIVDVSEADKALDFLKTFGIHNLTHLVTTHKHYDHSGGNKDLKEKFPHLEIIGGFEDDIPGCTHPIKDEEQLDIHGLHFKCFHTPCHTKGHILYYVTVGEEGKEEESKDTFEIQKTPD